MPTDRVHRDRDESRPRKSALHSREAGIRQCHGPGSRAAGRQRAAATKSPPGADAAAELAETKARMRNATGETLRRWDGPRRWPPHRRAGPGVVAVVFLQAVGAARREPGHARRSSDADPRAPRRPARPREAPPIACTIASSPRLGPPPGMSPLLATPLPPVQPRPGRARAAAAPLAVPLSPADRLANSAAQPDRLRQPGGPEPQGPRGLREARPRRGRGAHLRRTCRATSSRARRRRRQPRPRGAPAGRLDPGRPPTRLALASGASARHQPALHADAGAASASVGRGVRSAGSSPGSRISACSIWTRVSPRE